MKKVWLMKTEIKIYAKILRNVNIAMSGLECLDFRKTSEKKSLMCDLCALNSMFKVS